MQDFRSMQASVGGGGRIFGGDRRLRPFPNQALKCPRCESLNTKFCYYNNYNLSQPRHFCKSCRRYWTKGGVLRNVPVGGGCRKTKRSSKQKQPSQHKDKESKASMVDNSSSESSSLTNNTTTAAATAAAAAATAAVASTSTPGLIHNNNNIFNFEASMLDSGGLFAETGGSFTSMMTVSNPTSSSFLMYNNLSEISLQVQLQQEEEMKMQELTSGGCLDQTVPVDFRGMSSQELTALDWQNGDGNRGGDQTTLFDLPNSSVVDHGYWGQSQWTTTDHDQHLYLPP